MTLQQGRSSSKSTLLFLSSPTGCLLCRCEGTKHKRSRLQTLIHSHVSQPLHIFGSSRPKEGLLPSTSQPILFLGHCQFTSALFTNAQLRPQLAQGDTTYCHLSSRMPGSKELSTPLYYSLLSTCRLFMQPELSQNYCFPNSSFSLHNSAYNCSCPKVLAVFLADYNRDYPFPLTVKTLHLAFYSLLFPLICITPFKNPTWGFSTLAPHVTTTTLCSGGSDYLPGQHLLPRPCQRSTQRGCSSLHQSFPHIASYSS